MPGTYALGEEFLAEAVKTTAATGTTLQVRPFVFDTVSLRALIDCLLVRRRRAPGFAKGY